MGAHGARHGERLRSAHARRGRALKSMPVVTPEDLEEIPTTVSDPGWDYLPSLQPTLAAHRQDIAAFRTALTEGDNRLKQRFLDDEPVERLAGERRGLVLSVGKAPE